MFEIRDFLNGLHVGSATGWDLFILLIFLIAVLVYGFFLGKNRMIVLLLTTYFSFTITQVIPWQRFSSISWLGIDGEPSFSSKIAIFLALIILFYFLIPRSVLSSALRIRKRGEAGWLKIFILAIAQIGLLMMIILSMFPIDLVENLGSFVKKMFIGPEAQFVWLTLPILVMILMKRKKKLGKK